MQVTITTSAELGNRKYVEAAPGVYIFENQVLLVEPNDAALLIERDCAADLYQFAYDDIYLEEAIRAAL